MGLLDKLLPKKPSVKPDRLFGGYKTFTDLNPMFTRYDEGEYQQELTRAAISRIASACSKLKPEIQGNSKPRIRRLIETQPNEFMTWSKFLNRLSTMYEADGEAFIIPGFNKDMTEITALFPLYCSYAEIIETKNEPWMLFHFDTGDSYPIELKHVGILSKYPYKSDFFGETNCLSSTMSLIDAQNQAQDFAIRNGAKIRFIGRVNGQIREEDLEEKRNRFAEDQLSANNQTGILLYDGTFADVKQIDPTSYVIDSAEMQRIEQNVYTYFGVNENILQNSYDENTWSAFYEGKIEPFAIELGDVLNQMCFSQRERKAGNQISFSSNRLEYSSNASKRNMIRDMLDRGVFTLNEAREVLQMQPVEGGDVRVIRGEYVNAQSVSAVVGGAYPKVSTTSKNSDADDIDLSGDDVFYNDSDKYDGDDYEE